MSLLGLFDISKSALFASQTGLYVTGHNIANVNTPGYNRQEVVLETARPVATRGGFLGRGVRVVGIKRHFDRFIYNQLLVQTESRGKFQALSESLNQIEQIFNEARDMGLSGVLAEFANAWQDVATNPESVPHRTVLLKKAAALLMTAKGMEQRIMDTLENINTSVEDIVERINFIASEIARLNGKIMQMEAGLGYEKANDLRDQREQLLLELSELVDISYYEDKDGSVTVIVGMRNLVEKENSKRLLTRTDTTGGRDIYIGNTDITEQLKGGRLGGLLAVREDILNEPLYGLRRLIASIIKEINILHRSGYGLDGTTGNDFFSPLKLYTEDHSPGASISASIIDLNQLTLDEYTITFEGTNYYVYNKQSGTLVTSGVYVSGSPIVFEGIEVVITGTVTASDSFTVSPLTGVIGDASVAITDPLSIAAASSDTTLPGDNSNALAIARLFDLPITTLADNTFSDYYSGIVSTVGAKSRFASDSLRFEENLLDEIKNRRESISGVSLDEEALNLIKFQRAFEASARMIRVTDEILQTILNL